MGRRSGRPEDTSDHVVIGVEISARSRQIEITTMQHGSGRHVRYSSLNQAPPELRGQALELVRAAVLQAGYASLAELDAALTSELVVPEAENKEPDA
jgi:hypothetical protein